MPSQRNIKQLAALKEKLEKAASGVFVDHTGLKVSDQQDLRGKLKGVDGDFLVAKNTLLSLAFQTMTNDELRMNNGKSKHSTFDIRHSKFLSGPTSLVLSYQDEILPIKVLAQFSKDHEKPVIKGGFLGGKPLTGEEVLRISQLPSKEELLSQLVRQMQAPMVGLVNVLNGTMEKLVWALVNIEDQKSKIKDTNEKPKIN